MQLALCAARSWATFFSQFFGLHAYLNKGYDCLAAQWSSLFFLGFSCLDSATWVVRHPILYIGKLELFLFSLPQDSNIMRVW